MCNECSADYGKIVTEACSKCKSNEYILTIILSFFYFQISELFNSIIFKEFFFSIISVIIFILFVMDMRIHLLYGIEKFKLIVSTNLMKILYSHF